MRISRVHVDPQGVETPGKDIPVAFGLSVDFKGEASGKPELIITFTQIALTDAAEEPSCLVALLRTRDSTLLYSGSMRVGDDINMVMEGHSA